MKAVLKTYRQSPRKVRIVADLVRGKNVERALLELGFVAKRSSETIRKLIASAVANSGKEPRDLVVKEISVNEGATLKRSRPRSRGMSSRIHKRTSHVSVTLSEK